MVPGELTHDAGFFVGIHCFFRIQNFALCANRYKNAHDARKTMCADGEKQYFDRNTWDMSIDISYFVWIYYKWAYLDRHII